MSTSPLTTIRDTADLERVAGYLGSHWFDADAKAFFGSRVGATVYRGTGTDPLAGYFVSSEQFRPLYDPADARRYTVRSFAVVPNESRPGHDSIEIATAEGTEFQQFETRAQAIRAAKDLAKADAENISRGQVNS